MAIVERSDNINDGMVMAIATTIVIAITMIMAERSDNNNYDYGRVE